MLVKEGFCWPAFFFGALWALAKGLWLVALLLIAVWLGLTLALDWIKADALTAMAVWFAFALVVGFEGNDWWRHKLERRGRHMAGVIAADGRDAALRRWFDLNPRASADPPPPPPAAPPPGMAPAPPAPAGWPIG